jgi:hypothetical protein
MSVWARMSDLFLSPDFVDFRPTLLKGGGFSVSKKSGSAGKCGGNRYKTKVMTGGSWTARYVHGVKNLGKVVVVSPTASDVCPKPDRATFPKDLKEISGIPFQNAGS